MAWKLMTFSLQLKWEAPHYFLSPHLIHNSSSYRCRWDQIEDTIHQIDFHKLLKTFKCKSKWLWVNITMNSFKDLSITKWHHLNNSFSIRIYRIIKMKLIPNTGINSPLSDIKNIKLRFLLRDLQMEHMRLLIIIISIPNRLEWLQHHYSSKYKIYITIKN